MAKKQFTYKGKSIEELKNMTTKEFAKITNSRARKSLSKPMKESHEIFFNKLRKSHGKAIKTHCRDVVIVPEMIDSKVMVYSGKEFKEVMIIPEMVGHYLGEFSLTRNRKAHSSPGIGNKGLKRK